MIRNPKIVQNVRTTKILNVLRTHNVKPNGHCAVSENYQEDMKETWRLSATSMMAFTRLLTTKHSVLLICSPPIPKMGLYISERAKQFLAQISTRFWLTRSAPFQLLISFGTWNLNREVVAEIIKPAHSFPVFNGKFFCRCPKRCYCSQDYIARASNGCYTKPLQWCH